MKKKELKIKNAKRKLIYYNDIGFRSALEISHYKALVAAGFNPQYEKHTFLLFLGHYPKTARLVGPINKKGKKVGFNFIDKKIQNITYTPDFYFKHKEYDIYIETKGFSTDTYILKRKLFLGLLEVNNSLQCKQSIFFEPHSKKDLLECIKIINDL